MEGATATMKDY